MKRAKHLEKLHILKKTGIKNLAPSFLMNHSAPPHLQKETATVRTLSLFFCYCSCSEGMSRRGVGTLMYFIHSVSSLVSIWCKHSAFLCSFIFANVCRWITDFSSMSSPALDVDNCRTCRIVKYRIHIVHKLLQITLP
ncbi:hypothetical protein AV530_009909 [Patagioenas fasciata monilis]|uniref:Uncharacterized protein n=1 Tax=Patagioenas fasciata monilis TaxID=372326 RepID=A0A1V4KAH3_PATFA|nr:hypothetical protein AV530_009909 [Patagioenas fasciata monilis]